MKVLVIGGTGKTGRATLAALAARNVACVPAARNEAEILIDVTDPASVEAGARGHDAAYLITPIGPDEADIGVAAVAALRRAGIGKIVYLAIQNLEPMRAIPHFETKIPVRDAVLADGRSVVLGANFFMDNDLMAWPAIKAGMYPIPIGNAPDRGVWSIASPDIGEAAANALLQDTWAGQYVPLCGGERLNAARCAANWAAALGRPVASGNNDVAAFLATLGVPQGWLYDDMRAMFEVTQALGCESSAEDVARSEAIIGRPPMTHADFCQAIVKGMQQ
ncbi:MAG: SDR family oxidoreductase [Thermaurantiacus sp.]